MIARKRDEPPKDHKVTARFSAEEFKRLVEEARKRGEPISSLVRDYVVATIDEVKDKSGRG